MEDAGLANQAEYDQLMQSQDVNFNALNDENLNEMGYDSDPMSAGLDSNIQEMINLFNGSSANSSSDL